MRIAAARRRRRLVALLTAAAGAGARFKESQQQAAVGCEQACCARVGRGSGCIGFQAQARDRGRARNRCRRGDCRKRRRAVSDKGGEEGAGGRDRWAARVGANARSRRSAAHQTRRLPRRRRPAPPAPAAARTRLPSRLPWVRSLLRGYGRPAARDRGVLIMIWVACA